LYFFDAAFWGAHEVEPLVKKYLAQRKQVQPQLVKRESEIEKEVARKGGKRACMAMQ
jgi:hypothetical protein